jgi:16S rRNA processing protein RimM
MTAMIRVGQISGVFGVQGAVKVLPLTDFPDRFEEGSELYLSGVAHRVEWSRDRNPGLVLKLSGIDNRSLAELHRGRYLELPAAESKPLPSGRFYHHQLVGLRVSTLAGRELGTISDVLERPANDVWVARDGSLEQLIPATREAVLDVDLEAGTVVVADWLFEVEEA